MQITDILAQMGGLQSIARELGISETQAASGRRGAGARDPRRLQEAGAGSRRASTASAACSVNSAAAACSTTCWRRSRPT